MTGLDHCREAVRLRTLVEDADDRYSRGSAELIHQQLAAAEVHASLAQTALFALAMSDDGTVPEAETEAWVREVTAGK